MRTLSVPAGTVGATMARTMYPLCWQWAARLRARVVKMGMMGDCGDEVAVFVLMR